MHRSRPVLLSGRVVLPDGGARQRHVLVKDGAIRWISRSRPPAALIADAKEIVTGSQDWIFPGLIDLHTHASYNILPLWRSPRAPFDNRHVWRGDPGYRTEVRGVSKKIQGYKRARKVFSELQAVAGGTTLLDEPRPLDAEEGEGSTLLCRDTGSPRELGLAPGREVRSVVDFFRPGPSGQPEVKPGWGDKPPSLDAYVADRPRLQATLVHLAEGRSGFGSDRGVDPYSRAELEALMAHPAMRDAAAVRGSRLALVHGCGIDVNDSRHVDFLLERDISIIWSPASNMLLYGDTIDAGAFIHRGVNVAVGSDWSPSGSKHVWDEARFARFFLNAIGSEISDADVFKMVTTSAGRCLGLGFGRIEEGSAADFFILRSPIESDQALEVFFSTTDRDVLATIVDGLPIYGDRGFLEQFELELQSLPEREGSAVVDKAVHLPASIGVEDFAADITAVEDQLKALDPPVLRSNLLASSDPHYSRRFQFLRSRTERFGWSARRWQRKGASRTPGEVPVAPDAVRVRVGFRASQDPDGFLKDLGRTFLPARVALGREVGLTACLSAVPPKDKPAGCPDFVELDGHESQKVYERAGSTPGGRTSSMLGQTLFRGGESGSWSAFPRPYDGEVTAGGCYHLHDQEVDWHHGEVRLLLAARRPDARVGDFHAAVVETLDGMVEPAAERDGVLAAVGDDFLALWQHAPPGNGDAGPATPALEPVAEVVLSKNHCPVDAKAGLSDRWQGLDVQEGDCLNLVFERRALFPW